VILRAGDRTLHFGPGGRPLIMGVLNATPDSFSDAGELTTLADRLRRAQQLLDDGADVIDIGGESNVSNRPAVTVEEELERVVPPIERVSSELGALGSVDTYKPRVAEAAVQAGARIVNDISGLADTGLADVCARTGAGLVVMHTPVRPKTQELVEDRFADPVADVRAWLEERRGVARAHGVHDEQLVLDPGPDFGKTPAQTVALLRGLPVLAELGRPLLLAVSRKDFIGAIVPRRPRERLAGTLAAVGHAAGLPGTILRVHDVREVADFLAVRAVLNGDEDLDPGARVPDHLRREPVA